MSEKTGAPKRTSDDDTVTVVQVPSEHAQKVIDFVRSLEPTPDVTGYDFSGSVSFRRISISGSGCSTTGGSMRPSDFSCQDEDA